MAPRDGRRSELGIGEFWQSDFLQSVNRNGNFGVAPNLVLTTPTQRRECRLTPRVKHKGISRPRDTDKVLDSERATEIQKLGPTSNWLSSWWFSEWGSERVKARYPICIRQPLYQVEDGSHEIHVFGCPIYAAVHVSGS